jgi:dienelactone hydrolase
LGAAFPATAGAADVTAAGPADPRRDVHASRADLGTLFPEAERIAEGNAYAYSYLNGRFSSWAAFQAEARAKLLELLLYQPAPVDPRPEVQERIDCGAYFRERITFATAPGLRVPAYVLVPKNISQPAPAMVDLHSHGGMFLFGKEKVVDLGRNHPTMVAYHETNYEGRPTATALVQRGYVVITIDACMFGERRVMLDADLPLGWDRSRYSASDVTKLNQVCRAKESTVVKSLTLAGATWPGVVFWDDLRTVDYLLTRPDVDPRRIGCQGVSMGGYRALFLAALDPRIRAACVVGFMSTVRSMLKAHVDTHSFVHFLPALHRYLDWPDVASLAAPRSLLVQQCSRDRLFPLEGMKESVEKIAGAFERAGAKGQFVGRFYDVPHQYTRQMQDDAFAWFGQKL